jgi:ATP-binding cassette subfamily F protein 3
VISINNLTYHIGSRAIYNAISFDIKAKDKLGLIGLNGTGKSTLLKIVAGNIKPDNGNISIPKDYSIGFLNQDLLSYQTDNSILNVAMEAFDRVVSIQNEIEKLLEDINTNYDDKLVEKLCELQETFENLGGYEAQSKAEAVLEGIGFDTKDLSRPLSSFSGGWRMRVMLAKLLLEEPSLLMLDEPTNHLDIVSIQWLENYLKTYNKAFIVVSHDRNFLDSVITRTVELANSSLQTYNGNYSFYQQEKATRLDLQQKAYKNQQRQIKQTEDFIDRFRAKASKAKQVQSRIKSLDKIDKISSTSDNNASINFNLKVTRPSGRLISSLKNISKSFRELEILNNTNATIERGDKIALIGANGKGKSTLLRIIANSEKIDNGSVETGANVIPSFYMQHQLESLNLNKSILEELQEVNPNKGETEIRSTAGNFLFKKDDIFKKISVLSGGEKARVAIMKLLLSESNFLILDEPTNHLDILSINILSQALIQYQGTLILVSHDRHFISQVANKIWYIEDKQIKIYPGSYSEYTYHKANLK